MFSPISLHRFTLAIIYVFGLIAAVLVYRFPEAKPSIVAILATGSIFGTLGSAIMTMFGLYEKDLLERINLDLDILHRDIVKEPSPWRRWPFLKRSTTWKLYGGDTISTNLSNPPIRFHVGSHEETIDLPSVPEDFYDLPVLSNFLKLRRFRRAFMTKHTGDRQGKSIDEILQYECIFDVWRSIICYRIVRYVMHVGAALIVFGVVMVIWHILHFSPPLRRQDFNLW